MKTDGRETDWSLSDILEVEFSQRCVHADIKSLRNQNVSTSEDVLDLRINTLTDNTCCHRDKNTPAQDRNMRR